MDGYESGRREEEGEEKEEEKKLWEFVWGGKNVKVGIYLSIA